MARTIKLSAKQEQALIWAINTWDSSFDGFDEDDEYYQEFKQAYESLLPIYNSLGEESN